MGRHRSKVYPDYVAAYLKKGYSVRERNGSYYLYERPAGTSKVIYLGRITSDSVVVRRNNIRSKNDDSPKKIDPSSSLDSLVITGYIRTQNSDNEFGFSRFFINLFRRDEFSKLLRFTDGHAILVEIITSISPDSYLSRHQIEMKRKHCFAARKKEVLTFLGKNGVHVHEVYHLLKSIRIYEGPDGVRFISRVTEEQRNFFSKWGIEE